MAINELPTVNFDSYPGYDEFKFLHTTYSEEFKARSAISSQWGIVDSGYDPASAPFTAGRSLLVTVSPVNPLTIDIAAGYAITPSHLLIDIDAIVPSVPFPSLTAGSTYVVAVEYTLVSSPQQRVNRFGDLTEVRLERPANVPPGGGASTLLYAITVANINDYNNLGIFSAERKQNIVVIAIVNAQSDVTTSQIYLSIDLTRNSYSFNRPWFSVRDVEHRTKIGSGVITDNNPHGTDLQDLSSAGLTLYQQLKPRGGILAKDVSYFGYPGKICTEELVLSRWEADVNGTVTSPPGSPVVGGRYFVRLTKLPVRTGSLYFVGKPWEPIPYDWIPGTRTIVLGALENPATYSGSLVMEYFTVDALEINAESPTQGMQTLIAKAPASSQEFIISAGLAVSSLSLDTLALPTLVGPIKRGYQVVCDGRGALVLNPQPILASVKVLDLVGSTQTVNQAPLNGSAVYLTLGLTRALERTSSGSTVYDLDLKVQITGVDGNGTSRIEVLTFKGSQWKDQIAAVNEEEPLQFLRTIYKYQLVNSIALANTLSEPHNAGPEAILSLWADVLSGALNQEFATVASLFWTGTTGIRVKDERVIATSFDKLDQKQSRFPAELPDANVATVQELFSVLLDPPLTNPETPAQRLMLELDDDRMWSETWNEFSSTWASGYIALVNIAYVTAGQTIRIAPDKYLKIIPTTVFYTFTVTAATATIGAIYSNNGRTFVVQSSIAGSTVLRCIGSGTPIASGVLTLVSGTGDATITYSSFIAATISANPAEGEVNYNASDIIFKNNIISTINDPNWDSTWFSSLGAGTSPPILLSREDAYPEGFVLNTRQKIVFSGPFTEGSFSLKINGILVGPVSFTVDNLTTLTAIKTAIDAAATLTGGVTAIVYGTTSLILNGNQDGDVFKLTALTSSISPTAPTGSVQDIDETAGAFTLTQPSGGKLPTPHLPKRYPTALNPWVYLSRPFLWEGVGLEATIQINGDDPAYIGDFDAVEIAPSKVIFARVGTGATADPAMGQYLVDSASLSITLTNLVATVNHSVFASGILAEVDGNKVVLRSAGMAVTTLRLLAAVVPATWILTEVGGVTQYVPKGSGHGNAFLKTLKPLTKAEWRFMTVEDIANGWSLWTPLTMLSPTAYLFAAPTLKSLYQVQFKLESNETNSFTLYAYVPEVSDINLAALSIRVGDLETEMAGARGSTLIGWQLADRLVSIVELDGTPIQDPELTATHSSVILPDSACLTLKARLDTMDSRLYFASFGGVTPHGVVTGINAGLPPQLISGPVDFVTTFGLIAYVGGNIGSPLLAQINGFTYSYSRQLPFTFVGGGTPSPVVGLYYAYLEESTPWGFELVTGSVTVTAGNTSATVTEDLSLAKIGHLFVIPAISIGGQPLVMPITNIIGQTLIFNGQIPASLTTTYSIYNPREGIIQIESTAKTLSSNRLYLGEINWTGSAISAISYRYLNKYTSAIVEADARGGSYTLTFAHNLGFIPPTFTLYFYEDTTGTLSGSPSGDPKVLHIGDEAVVKTTKYVMTVRNRYANLVARNYSGVTAATGYLQLII